MLVGMVPAFPNIAEAASSVFTEDFGTGSDSATISGWEKHEDSTIVREGQGSGEDIASPNGGRFAKIAEDSDDGGTQDGYICKEINAEDFENLTLSYYWNGDFEAEGNEPGGPDLGIVEARNNGNGDANCGAVGGWDELQSHDLTQHSDSWNLQSAFDISDYDGTKFLIRFRNDTSANDEWFRVDGINISGDAVAPSCTPQYNVTGPTAIQNTDTSEYFNSIQNAIDDCDTVDGNTIDVDSGTHNEDVNVNKQLTLEGNNAATVNGRITISDENVIVNAFTITNPTGTKGVFVDGVGNIAVTNNEFTQIGSDNSVSANVHAFWYQDATASVSNLNISNNTFDQIGHDMGASATAIGIGDSTGSTNVTGVTINGNTINNVVSRHDVDYNGGGRGAYGILINHAKSSAGGTTANVEINDNSISNLEGLWVHAIGLEGETPNAVITGNDISNIVEHKLALEGVKDGVGIFFEQNDNAENVEISQNNFYTDGTWYGIAVHPAMTGDYAVDAEMNYWNTISSSTIDSYVYASDDISIDYEPWLCEDAYSTFSSVDGKCVKDETTPVVTVKDGAITCELDGYYKVSFKLHDGDSGIDKIVLNGVEKDLSNNKWSDLNNVEPGKFGAVEGMNIMLVYDVAGNVLEYVFYLCGDPSSAPTATVKDGDEFTDTCEAGYDMVSYKLFDEDKIDKVVINGVEKDLTDNKWSDVNFIKPGVFGAKVGENTMVVYDVLGNNSTYTFFLCEGATVC